MKIVHINTHDTGGAFNAAVRLHNGLLKEQVDSYFLTLGSENKSIVNKIEVPAIKLSLIDRISTKLRLPLTHEGANWNAIKNKTKNYEFHSFPRTDYKLHLHPILKDADIINLHWCANFIDIPSFFKNIKTPIVWTLHDMNPFQGGFHYKCDEIKNSEEFKSLEKRSLKLKKEAYSRSSISTIITPSNWLSECSKNSSLLKQFTTKTIPNGLETIVYKPSEGEIRKEYNIPENKKILLFISQNVNNPRKGFSFLLEALKKLDQKDIHFICIGASSGPIDNNVQQLGSINSEKRMAELYSLADAFILPSLEDNLPNTMLESLCCGTPVIAFNIGGMKDQIIDQENGFLAPQMTSESLFTKINLFLTNGVNKTRAEISSSAHEKFSLKNQAIRYIDLYQNIL